MLFPPGTAALAGTLSVPPITEPRNEVKARELVKVVKDRSGTGGREDGA